MDGSNWSLGLVDRVVMSVDGRYAGSVGCVWGDTSTRSDTFAGVRSLGAGGEPRILPLAMCRIEGAFVRTPFTCEQIHAAPTANPREELNAETRDQARRYYASSRQPVPAAK